MKISQIQEDTIIQNIQKLAPPLPLGFTGIGDDCAVIPKNTTESWVITTDALVEDIHFTRTTTPPLDLAYKSLMVNISDIAAMGATPKFAFLTLSLPHDLHLSWLNTFTQSLANTLKSNNILLLGGDTTASKNSIFINITLIGEINTQHIKFRHTAQANDLIVLTRPLGASKAGLHLLLEHTPPSPLHPFITAHLHPSPQINESSWLAKSPHIHAMMDISDGLSIDLPRLAKSSNLGATLNLNQIPLPAELDRFTSERNINPYTFAATSGEEYSLMLAINPNHFKELSDEFNKLFNQSLYPVGQFTKETTIKFLLNNTPVNLSSQSYSHFS